MFFNSIRNIDTKNITMIPINRRFDKVRLLIAEITISTSFSFLTEKEQLLPCFLKEFTSAP